MRGALYNEIDPFAADWLRRLIRAGHIAPGEVCTTPIQELLPSDIAGFDQVHLFAGIGGWSLALRLAGWPDDRPVWTGSAPCQPFSTAGKGSGTDDPRHLWPHMRRLIEACRPVCCFGEQVASPAGRRWYAGVSDDLEALGYRPGAAGLAAGGVGAPHGRSRLYWVADTVCGERQSGSGAPDRQAGQVLEVGAYADGCRVLRPVADCLHPELEGRGECRDSTARGSAGSRGLAGTLVQPQRDRRHGPGLPVQRGRPQQTGPDAPWSGAVALPLSDGTRRRASTEPGAFPLAHGIPARLGHILAGLGLMDQRAGTAARRNRTGRIRGYGNAIVPAVAAEFVGAYLEVIA